MISFCSSLLFASEVIVKLPLVSVMTLFLYFLVLHATTKVRFPIGLVVLESTTVTVFWIFESILFNLNVAEYG